MTTVGDSQSNPKKCPAPASMGHGYITSLLRMPPKRTNLDSPNPVKHQMVEIERVDEATAELAIPPSAPNAVVLAELPVISDAQVAKVEDLGESAAAAAASSSAPATPPRNTVPSPSVPSLPLLPTSPSNRARYLEGRQPTRICCNLDLMRAVAGARIAISAICVAVFPASMNPDRRYIQLADPYGSTGITVWNSHVNKFGFSSVGKLVTCARLVVGTHNGKRCLTMARDSGLDIEDDGKHAVVDWWKGLLNQPILTTLEAHSASENSMISVSGVVGSVTEEAKIVGGIPRTLTTINLVDATGKFDVRTWNHVQSQFSQHVDRPVVIRRVRVTSFAGEKLAELLDGNGSEIHTKFPGFTALLAWWHSQD